MKGEGEEEEEELRGAAILALCEILSSYPHSSLLLVDVGRLCCAVLCFAIRTESISYFIIIMSAGQRNEFSHSLFTHFHFT